MPDIATEVACRAHARRKFVDAETTDPELAQHALDLIAVLYGTECDAKDAAKVLGREPSADEVRSARQERSVPQLAAIRAWLVLTEAQILPRGDMAEAMRYCLDR
ncbi:MAG: transposase [Planctomycetota bacterium]